MTYRHLLLLPILLVYNTSTTVATSPTIVSTITKHVRTILNGDTSDNRKATFDELNRIRTNQEATFGNALKQVLQGIDNHDTEDQKTYNKWEFTKLCMQDKQWSLAYTASQCIKKGNIPSMLYTSPNLDFGTTMYNISVQTNENHISYHTIWYLCKHNSNFRFFLLQECIAKKNWLIASKICDKKWINSFPTNLNDANELYNLLTKEEKKLSALQKRLIAKVNNDLKNKLVARIKQEKNMVLGKRLLKNNNRVYLSDFEGYDALCNAMIQDDFDDLSFYEKLYSFNKEYRPAYLYDRLQYRKHFEDLVKRYRIKCGVGGALVLLVLGGGGYYYYKTSTKTAKKSVRRKLKRNITKKLISN